MVRWFISDIASVDIPSSEGGGIRRIPRLCYLDKYPCTSWGAVFFDDKRRAFVRFETDAAGVYDAADFVEELVTPEQWDAFYQSHPELKNRWSDQP